MVMLKGKESSNKNAKSFEETSIYNKAPLTAPHCEACGEPLHIREGANIKDSSCPYCGFNAKKHSSYSPERYDKEILTQGICYSVYKVKNKRRRKRNKELDDESDDYIEECGEDLLIGNLDKEN